MNIGIHTIESLLKNLIFVITIIFIMAGGNVESETLTQVALANKEFTSTVLDDGVVVWQRSGEQSSKPRFFSLMESLYGGTISESTPLPNGRSVAFLVGVSNYEDPAFPNLPFVYNDIEAMTNFLLGSGGFDEVFVATNEVATKDLIGDYMSNKFRNLLGSEDRLLFYFSGHGIDMNGGHMVLGRAKPDDYVLDVIRISDVKEWSRHNKNKHMLFIVDCCASGLNTEKWLGRDDRTQIVNSLDGNGSRILLTAGRGLQKTYSITGDDSKTYSLFTYSLLKTVTGLTNLTNSGMLNIEQIYMSASSLVQKLARDRDLPVAPDPQISHLREDVYTGTFLFLAESAKNLPDIPILREWFSADGQIRVFINAPANTHVLIDDAVVESNSYVEITPGEHSVRTLTRRNPLNDSSIIFVNNASIVDVGRQNSDIQIGSANVRFAISESSPKHLRRSKFSFEINGFPEKIGMFSGLNSIPPGQYLVNIGVGQTVFGANVIIKSISLGGKSFPFVESGTIVDLEPGTNRLVLTLADSNGKNR